METIKKDGEETVLDTVSPALKYEALLAACKGGLTGGPSEDKSQLVFRVLDQLQPHTGVFSKILQMCRDQLFESVYSDQYTSGPSSQQASRGEAYIARVPYFVLVRRVYSERDERNEQLEDTLTTVKKRLFDKQKQFEEATDTIASRDSTIRELSQTVAELEQNVADRNNHIKRSWENTLEEEKTAAATREHELSCDIAELTEDLNDARNTNKFLAQYKEGYDRLEQAFQVSNDVEEDLAPKPKKKKSAIATKRAHLISGIEDANKLENQLLTVQNLNIEEFDTFLEEHKSVLASNSGGHDALGQDLELDQVDRQLQVTQNRFKKGIAEINKELDLLRQHRTGLQEQLQELEETKPSSKKAKKKPKTNASRPTTQENPSGLLAGLTPPPEEGKEEGDGSSLDPFVIQERIFSKFAAMLYTSDNGKTFHEFKGAQYCQSCGEKTVLCPHKILSQEHVFSLPPNVTHIKVSRPKVRINMQLMDNLFRPQTSSFSNYMLPTPDGKGFHSRVSISAAMISPLVESVGITPAESAGGGMPYATDPMHYTHSIQRLWEDYKARTDLERSVTRPLTLTHLLSLIEQYAAHLLWLDESHREGETPSHILDSLYAFMIERYQRPDMAYLVTYDLITALIEHCSTNKFVWLYTQVLIGNLDAAVFRYLLLIGDFIKAVSWQSVADIRAFVAVIYPALTEDDLENLQMGYVSFSENKISGSLVAEYIIYIIMKYREPRFLEMENLLLATPVVTSGYLTQREYCDASDHLLDVPDAKLRARLYGETQAYIVAKDRVTCGVPVLRLAQITSHLQLLDRYPVILENINAHVVAARQQTGDHGDQVKAGKPQDASAQFKVIGMSEVKTLANNNARRVRCRKIRFRGGLDGD